MPCTVAFDAMEMPPARTLREQGGRRRREPLEHVGPVPRDRRGDRVVGGRNVGDAERSRAVAGGGGAPDGDARVREGAPSTPTTVPWMVTGPPPEGVVLHAASRTILPPQRRHVATRFMSHPPWRAGSSNEGERVVDRRLTVRGFPPATVVTRVRPGHGEPRTIKDSLPRGAAHARASRATTRPDGRASGVEPGSGSQDVAAVSNTAAACRACQAGSAVPSTRAPTVAPSRSSWSWRASASGSRAPAPRASSVR